MSNKFEKRLIKKSNGNFSIDDLHPDFHVPQYRGWFKSVTKAVTNGAKDAWDCLEKAISITDKTYICCNGQVNGTKEWGGEGTTCNTNGLDLGTAKTTQIADMVTNMTCFGLSWVSVGTCPFWKIVNKVVADTSPSMNQLNVNSNLLCYVTPSGASTAKVQFTPKITYTPNGGQKTELVPAYNATANTDRIKNALAFSRVAYACYGCDGETWCTYSPDDGALSGSGIKDVGTEGVYYPIAGTDPLQNVKTKRILIDPKTQKKTELPLTQLQYNKYAIQITFDLEKTWDYQYMFLESELGESSITLETNDTGLKLLSPYGYNLKNGNRFKGNTIISTLCCFSILNTNQFNPKPQTNLEYVLALGKSSLTFYACMSFYFQELKKKPEYLYSPSEQNYLKLLNKDLLISERTLSKNIYLYAYDMYFLGNDIYSRWLQALDNVIMFIFYILMTNAKEKNIDFKRPKFQNQFYRYILRDLLLEGLNTSNFTNQINDYFSYLGTDLLTKNYNSIVQKNIEAIIRTEDTLLQITISYTSKKYSHDVLNKDSPQDLGQIVFNNMQPLRQRYAFFKKNATKGLVPLERPLNYIDWELLPGNIQAKITKALRSVDWRKAMYKHFCPPSLCTGFNKSDSINDKLTNETYKTQFIKKLNKFENKKKNIQLKREKLLGKKKSNCS